MSKERPFHYLLVSKNTETMLRDLVTNRIGITMLTWNIQELPG